MRSFMFHRTGLALCLLWLAFCVFPLWWIVVTAFKPPLAVSQGATYLPFIDFQPSLEPFREAFSGIRGDFFGPIFSSVAIAIVATFFSVLFGSMAAYALLRYEFRIKLVAGISFAIISIGGFSILNYDVGLSVPMALVIVLVVSLVVSIWLNGLVNWGPVLGNDDVTFWFVSQRIFPPIVSAFALFLLYAEASKSGFRLLDSFFGMTLAYTAFGLPFAVWLMRDFLSTIPVEIEEAAEIDNIGRIRIFLEIVLPMSKPGLIATSMIVLSFVWNEFLFALLLTSSKWQTLPILLAGQNSSRGDEWWAISVATLISIVPMIIVATILGRMMRSGLLAGSIK